MTPQDNPQDVGASLRETGSHAAHEAPSGLRPTGFDPAREALKEAGFLCARLRELEGEIFDDRVGREYYGHVAPSARRLEILLAESALSLGERQ